MDDERSWPIPGKLNIDGLTYQVLNPADAATRLRCFGVAERRLLGRSEQIALAKAVDRAELVVADSFFSANGRSDVYSKRAADHLGSADANQRFEVAGRSM